MTKDTGGWAFPVPHNIDGNWQPDPRTQFSGMTLRDYFAAAALTGIASAMRYDNIENWLSKRSAMHGEDMRRALSEASFAVADAMLAERGRYQHQRRGNGETAMKVFIWERIADATENWHSGGGLVIFAKDEARARELAAKEEGCHLKESEVPDEVRDCADGPERVFVMPDAGCC